MKKIYIAALMALSVLTFSCGKSTSKTPQEQLKAGTWSLQSQIYVSNIGGNSYDSTIYSGYSNYTLKFLNDTQVTEVNGNTTSTRDYQLVDDYTLSIWGNTYDIYTLTSTKLTFSRTKSYTDGTYYTYRYNYTRSTN